MLREGYIKRQSQEYSRLRRKNSLSLVKMLSGLNTFGISNIHGGEFKVRSLWESNVTMLRLARIRRKEFVRTTGGPWVPSSRKKRLKGL
jgi:hypothetical protein